MLLAAAVDVEIDATTATASEIKVQSIGTRIRAIEQLSQHIVAIHLLTPRSEWLQYLAGQKVRARIAAIMTALSIASCPCEERRIERHMLVKDANAFSHPATQELKINEIAELTGPYGDFILDEASTRSLILIAEGAGYPPIKSLIQHACRSIMLRQSRPIGSPAPAGTTKRTYPGRMLRHLTTSDTSLSPQMLASKQRYKLLRRSTVFLIAIFTRRAAQAF